jgi:allantoicase
MDSWETVRHNQSGCDNLIFEMKKESPISFVSISTKFHLGNQAQFVKVEGLDNNSGKWIEIISKTALLGHAEKKMLALNSKIIFSKILVSLYPDGGLTRLGLYSDALPENEKKQFLPIDQATSIIFSDEIAKTLKPLAAPYAPDSVEIAKNWKSLSPGEEFDVANLAFGGKILSASNEHYGPAIQTISPFSPMHMFDGFESARSREKNHQEEVVIQLAKSSVIHRIVMDFTFFVNNNPFEMSVLGLSGKEWITIVDKTNVKAFAGNCREFKISLTTTFEQVKVIAHPDGGVNRIRVFTRA